MAHRHQIIEVQDSDEEEVNETSVAQQGRQQSHYPSWSLFAPPDETMDQDGDSTLSEENIQVHLPSPPPPMRETRLRLADLLNEGVPGPSSSRPMRPLPKRASPLPSSTLPDPAQDDKLRRLLGLPPYDYPDNSGIEDNLSSTLDHEGPSLENATEPVSTRQLISEYQCPICFCPPTHSCLTTCGHLMCAQCLFSSVRAARERYVRLYGRGPGRDGEGKVSRCPICRAVMKGWDGKGGGVLGLKMVMKGINERTEIQMQF